MTFLVREFSGKGNTMKLGLYKATLEEKMSEFDIWVTPSLGEIRDMPQFKENLNAMKNGFDIVAKITNNFNSVSDCSSSALAKSTVELIGQKSDKEK